MLKMQLMPVGSNYVLNTPLQVVHVMMIETIKANNMHSLDRGKMEYFKWLEDQQDLATNTSYFVNGYDDNPRYYFWFSDAKILRNALADFADEHEDHPVMMTSVMSVDGECTVTGNDPEHVAAFENLLKRKG